MQSSVVVCESVTRVSRMLGDPAFFTSQLMPCGRLETTSIRPAPMILSPLSPLTLSYHLAELALQLTLCSFSYLHICISAHLHKELRLKGPFRLDFGRGASRGSIVFEQISSHQKLNPLTNVLLSHLARAPKEAIEERTGTFLESSWLEAKVAACGRKLVLKVTSGCDTSESAYCNK